LELNSGHMNGYYQQTNGIEYCELERYLRCLGVGNELNGTKSGTLGIG